MDGSALIDGEAGLQAIAEDMLAAVERGAAGEWVMPWSGFAARPTNAFSGRAFRGQNQLTLWAAARRRRLTVHLWASPKQWERNGGRIRRGETGTLILVPVFDEEAPAARLTPEATRRMGQKLGGVGGDPEGTDMRSMIGFKREHWFAAEQVDGVAIASPALPSPSEAAKLMEATLDAWHRNKQLVPPAPFLRQGGLKAMWAPATDVITMPPKEAFQPRAGVGAYELYVQTRGHESIHATGSRRRCGRDMKGSFGSSRYAKEELVALSGQSAPSATLQ